MLQLSEMQALAAAAVVRARFALHKAEGAALNHGVRVGEPEVDALRKRMHELEDIIDSLRKAPEPINHWPAVICEVGDRLMGVKLIGATPTRLEVILDAFTKDGKIPAIKQARTELGCDLKAAKSLVDALVALNLGPVAPKPQNLAQT